MSKRLALDTSYLESAMVLIADGRMVQAATWSRSPGRERPLIGRLGDLLREAGWSVDDLDAVAAGRGPGSFTGLRTGLSVAGGLGYGANIPLFLMDSLEVVAARGPRASVTAVLRDAGRSEVYAWRPGTDAVRLPTSAIGDWLRGDDRVMVEPPGALQRWSGPQARLEVPADHQGSRAEALTLVANQIFKSQKPVRYDELQPRYSQPAAAEERRGKPS